MSFLLGLLVVFFLVFPLPGRAITREDLEIKRDELKSNNFQPTADFSKQQQSIIVILNRNIARVNSAIAKIESSAMDATNKKMAINSLIKVKSDLETFSEKVNKATSIEELKTLNKEIVNYLKENKDVIRQQVSGAIVYLGQQFFSSADKILKQIEQVLVVLKIQCNGKTGSEVLITEIETGIKSLESSLKSLELALSQKNTVQIKSLTKQITILTRTIIVSLGSLKTTCKL